MARYIYQRPWLTPEEALESFRVSWDIVMGTPEEKEKAEKEKEEMIRKWCAEHKEME